MNLRFGERWTSLMWSFFPFYASVHPEAYLISWRKHDCGTFFERCEIRTNKCISLQFPTETLSTCNHFRTQLWLQLHMFRFLDVTSLLGSSAGTELDLGCGILGYGSCEKHDSRWKSWRMRDRKTTNTLLLPLSGHFTWNMSRNVHAGTYLQNSSHRYVFVMRSGCLKFTLTKMHSICSTPATSRKRVPVKTVNQEKLTGSSQVSPNTKWYSEWRCQDVSVFCELIFWHNASSPSLWVKREAVMLQQVG